MDPNQIAVVRLARGEVGYYDQYTSLHLTIMNPVGTVGRGQNLTGITRSVKSGRLMLISGSLEPMQTPVAAPIIMQPVPVVTPPAVFVPDPAMVEAASLKATEIDIVATEVVEPVTEDTEGLDDAVIEDDTDEAAAADKKDKVGGKNKTNRK